MTSFNRIVKAKRMEVYSPGMAEGGGRPMKKASKARKAGTYRGALRNSTRSTRAVQLKELRLSLGLTRSEFDRQRTAGAA